MAFVAVTPDDIDVFSLRPNCLHHDSTSFLHCALHAGRTPLLLLLLCFCVFYLFYCYSTVVIRISCTPPDPCSHYLFLLNEEEEREKTDEKTLVAQVGFEPPTFRSCGQHSVHYTTEAPPIPDVLLVKVVTKKGGSSFVLTRHLVDS